MKTGQIIAGVIGVAGLTALVVYSIKKSSAKTSEDITKGTGNVSSDLQPTTKTQSSGSNIMDSTNNPNADLGLITKAPEVQYPSTGFKTTAEGNAFRKWFNDSFPKTAKNIQLDRTGAYDNKYIRRALALKGLEYQAYLKRDELSNKGLIKTISDYLTKK